MMSASLHVRFAALLSLSAFALACGDADDTVDGGTGGSFATGGAGQGTGGASSGTGGAGSVTPGPGTGGEAPTPAPGVGGSVSDPCPPRSSPPLPPQPMPTITQGLAGTVENLEGNFAPGPCGGSGSRTLVSRKVRIYAPTGPLEGTFRESDPTVYESLSTTLVAETTSDASGFYEVELPPGNYSVVVEDGGGWFCSVFGCADDVCTLCPAAVVTGEVAEYDIEITRNAAF